MIKKYNFIPEHQISKASSANEFTVSIIKAMSIYISKFDVDMFELDKKVIRIYADIPNKTIAWKEIKNGNLDVLKDVRQFNKNPVNGNILLGVNKILKQMGFTKEMLPITNIPVTEYKDTMLEGTLKVIDLKTYLKK